MLHNTIHPSRFAFDMTHLSSGKSEVQGRLSLSGSLENRAAVWREGIMRRPPSFPRWHKQQPSTIIGFGPIVAAQTAGKRTVPFRRSRLIAQDAECDTREELHVYIRKARCLGVDQPCCHGDAGRGSRRHI
jgi:hypothetical protein